MKTSRFFPLAALMAAGIAVLPLSGAEDIREIRLRQDDAQVRFATKLYELKNISAEEILPFVSSAVLRYNANSTVRRVTGGHGPCGALLVSTGRDFLPYVDDIVSALDGEADAKNPGISGTGVARVVYTPSFRSADDFVGVLNKAVVSDAGAASVNKETNTIFWRDQSDSAERTLSWVKQLDRPLPQARIRLNYYELRDSDLKDWGVDYLAWKNGPGVNLFNAGYNAGEIIVNELLQTAMDAAVASGTWGIGGFFTAPQFDMSFIRCLQQSGNANATASNTLAFINTPVTNEKEYAKLKAIQEKFPKRAPFIYSVAMYPEYQNISKNVLGRTVVGKSYYEDEDGIRHPDPPALEAKIVNPFICFSNADKSDARGFIPYDKEHIDEQIEIRDKGGVTFDYSLYFKSVVERGNTGGELSNNALVCGSASIAYGKEKILAVYGKENDVEQVLGIPVLCRIPILKYLFSTTTKITERTYIVVSAEAVPIGPDESVEEYNQKIDSANIDVERRIEDPLHTRRVEEKMRDKFRKLGKDIEQPIKDKLQEEEAAKASESAEEVSK
ncbi:MAG: hypothetical protein MJ025_04845 [Victivallaceae bacterium]|nr:hypothetical protein [Victivallaceae bacterium]